MPPIDPVIQTIIAEALGEGPEGMRLVGETIVNRAEQRGLTPADVVRQPYQYTGYSSPGPDAQRAFNDPSAITAAQAAWNLAKAAGDPTGGANHYLNPKTATDLSWMNKLTPTMTHGGHAFYTDRPGYTQKGLGPLAPSNIAQVSPTTAALRQMTSPTNGNTALQTALNQYAIRERNRVTPAIPPWAAMGMTQGSGPVQSGALSAEQKAAANRAALMMNQSYVGQDSKGGTIPYPGVDARMEAARRAALSMGGNFSYAGNQGSGKIPNDRLLPGQSGLPAKYGTFSPNQVNAMGIPVGGSMINGNVPVGKVAPTPFPKPNFGPLAPVPFNKPNFSPKSAPVPYAKPNFGKVAPVPFDRPNFGMGGPGFAPVNAAAMAQGKVAPQPQIPAWASMGMNQKMPTWGTMEIMANSFPGNAPAPVAPPRPAVGTVLGMAGNGGLQTQGFGGVNNSITQKNFAEAQGMQINPNGTMSLMAGGGPAYVNGVVTGGGNDRNPSAARALTPQQLAALQAKPASPYSR